MLLWVLAIFAGVAALGVLLALVAFVGARFGPGVDDPAFGRLRRSRGRWYGRATLPGLGEVTLALPGPRSGPRADARALVLDLGRMPTVTRTAIEAHLVETYDQLRDPDVLGTALVGRLDTARHQARGDRPGAFLDEFTPVAVEVTLAPRAEGLRDVRIEYLAPWDDEHTLTVVLDTASRVRQVDLTVAL